MTDPEWLSRIKENPEAFSELFSLYYRPIFNYIFRRTGEFDDTADIAADTFLKAFQFIDRFNYRGISIKVWLFRIATNEVNLYYRHLNKHRSVFDRSAVPGAQQWRQYLQEDRENFEKELHQHKQFMSILQNLKRLPLKYQEVIALRYFEGKDNKEVAEILDTKEGTVKSILSRGLDKLRIECNRHR